MTPSIGPIARDGILVVFIFLYLHAIAMNPMQATVVDCSQDQRSKIDDGINGCVNTYFGPATSFGGSFTCFDSSCSSLNRVASFTSHVWTIQTLNNMLSLRST